MLWFAETCITIAHIHMWRWKCPNIALNALIWSFFTHLFPQFFFLHCLLSHFFFFSVWLRCFIILFKKILLKYVWFTMLDYFQVYSKLRTVWKFLKKLNIKLPYDSTIPLLNIYAEKTIIQKDTCSPMFTAALFIIAKTWKQPKCPPEEEQGICGLYVYT